jgi:hypothetical protein
MVARAEVTSLDHGARSFLTSRGQPDRRLEVMPDRAILGRSDDAGPYWSTDQALVHRVRDM